MSIRSGQQRSLNDWLCEPILEATHRLVILADAIPWEAITLALLPFFSKVGRRAKQIRLMTGLLMLKHLYDVSDEKLVDGLHENVYWQHFCGVSLTRVVDLAGEGSTPDKRLRRELDSSTLSKFRKRIGSKGLMLIEEALYEELRKAGLIRGRTIIADTTVQPKNVQYPTETSLLDRGRKKIITIIQKVRGLGIDVAKGMRSFTRVAKRAIIEAFKLGKDRFERIRAANKKLSRYARHVIRRANKALPRIRRHTARAAQQGRRLVASRLARHAADLKHVLELTKRVIHQNAERYANRRVSDKVLSLHESHVVAICKGKRSAPTEFGTKVALAIEPSGAIVAHHEYAANIGDVKTVRPILDEVEKRNGRAPRNFSADRGMHHAESQRTEVGTDRVARVAIPAQGRKPAPASDTRWFRDLQRIRPMIEPIIGHLKADHRMNRSRYKGFDGDKMNTTLSVMAWNLKKLANRKLEQLKAAAKPSSDRQVDVLVGAVG